jgi:hypothetical protein
MHSMQGSFEREARAERLARETFVLPPAVAEFDRALATWLDSFACIDGGSSLGAARYIRPVLEVSAEDEWLEGALARLAGPARVYAWARLWKAYDRLHADGIGLGAVGHGLARHLVDARPGRLSPETTLALHRYFEDIVDSPTSGIYHALWDRSRKSGVLGRRAGGQRDAVLLQFLRLLERRAHHHQLRDLRRILYSVRRGDERTATALRRFAPHNDQDAALFAGHVIRTVGLREDDRRPGALSARVMRWFLSGRSRPTRAWIAACQEITRAIGEDRVALLARWVRARSQVGPETTVEPRDELFAFASRSSAWLLGGARGAKSAR